MRSRQVKTLRKTLGLTQQQFATFLGTSFVSVNRWENGHTKPIGLGFVLLKLLQEAVALHPVESIVSQLRKTADPLSRVKLLATLAQPKER